MCLSGCLRLFLLSSVTCEEIRPISGHWYVGAAHCPVATVTTRSCVWAKFSFLFKSDQVWVHLMHRQGVWKNRSSTTGESGAKEKTELPSKNEIFSCTTCVACLCDLSDVSCPRTHWLKVDSNHWPSVGGRTLSHWVTVRQMNHYFLQEKQEIEIVITFSPVEILKCKIFYFSGSYTFDIRYHLI